MANLHANLIALLACLSFVFGYVSGDAQEFQRLKARVFKKGDLTYYAESIEEYINRMIQLLETGEVPAVDQGKVTLEYLKSLAGDCAVERECNPHRDVSKLERLNKRLIETESELGNLSNYLRTCKLRLQENCAASIYQRVIKTVAPVSERDMALIDAVAQRVYEDVRPVRFVYGIRHELDLNIDYSPPILMAFRDFDPVAAKKIAKKWTGPKRALKEFMVSNIQLPCNSFLKHIDPIVQVYPMRYIDTTTKKPEVELPKLHFFMEVCMRIVDDWDKIIKAASKNYKQYLVEPKYEYSSDSTGGISTSDIMFLGSV